MAEPSGPPEPPRGWRAFIAFIQQWQIVLTAVAAITALWFNYNEQRRTELLLNRDAVAAARTEAMRAAFLADPQNTLTEFQATFPRHAFCAALGFFIAESGRQNRLADARSDGSLNDMNDAVLVEVEAVAAGAGLDAEAFAAFVATAVKAATPAEGPPRCAQVSLPPPGVAGRLTGPECSLAVETFGQNRCDSARWAARQATAIAAEAATIVAAGPPPGDLGAIRTYGRPPAPVPASPEPPTEPATEIAPRIAPPGAACGGTSPLVFAHFADPDDRDSVAELRAGLVRAGWKITEAENVPDGRSAGDVRIYTEAQRGCAQELASALAALPQIGRSLPIISLEGRYRGLPSDQMELWLPALE